MSIPPEATAASLQLHPSASRTFVDIVVPLATPKTLTYHVPEAIVPQVQFGLRVEVQLGRKLYTGLILEVHRRVPDFQTKHVLSVVDETPLVTPTQIRLWRWIARYYCCSLGEVMDMALPAHLKLSSERRIMTSPLFDPDYPGLSDAEFLLCEALSVQSELSIQDVRGILNRKSVYPVVVKLLDKQLIIIKDEIREKYSAKKVGCVRLREPYASQSELLDEAFAKCSRSPQQTAVLMAYVMLHRPGEHLRVKTVREKARCPSNGPIKALEKKEIFELYEREVSRLKGYEDDTAADPPMSAQQERALGEIKQHFASKDVVLLHGVTGSGKTRVYTELIRAALQREEQVLYLLPEVGLTTQITRRLQRIFGDDIAVYHHQVTNNERVELWKATIDGKPILLGARSALFLPFQRLRLVIIDEEHDPSFKQNDPAPRYHGRDTAIVLAKLHGAKVVLGSATPAVESYHNTRQGKYGLVEMPERFGDTPLPRIQIIDAKQEAKERKLQAQFTSVLIEKLTALVDKKEQAILFQNRRGHSPTLRCVTCGWHQECINCDVSLTYHKYFDNLQCHYCGYKTELPKACPSCGDRDLKLLGFGTQRIEEELPIYLPNARIRRMDSDTVRNKGAHSTIIQDFEDGKIDVLIGTQMVTKGLDFANLSTVGVVSADQLLQFPNFRATERGFQLLTQVAGRAGRRAVRGEVLIQAMNAEHPVLAEVLNNDYAGFYAREIKERHEFQYPPFSRLIRITLKHKIPKTLNAAAQLYGHWLHKRLSGYVQGPAEPYVSRVRGQYLLDFLVKLPRQPDVIDNAKRVISGATIHLKDQKGFSGVRINVDVDPM